MRDALSAVRNLEQLLQSINVGPKAIGAVLPDVHSACRPFVSEVRELLDAVGKHLDDTECIHALVDHMTPPVAELEGALAVAMKRTMNAKGRLELEPVVAKAANELDSALDVLALLEEAVAGRDLSVSISEIARECFDTATGDDALEVAASFGGDSCEVEVAPRAVVRLIRTCVSVVAATTDKPAVFVGKRDAQCGVWVEQATGGETMRVSRIRLIHCSVACADAAARAMGGRVTVSPDRSSASVTWPA